MEERTIYQTLQDFGNKVQSDLRKSLVDKKSNASKNLSQSIAFNVKFKSDTEIQFKLELDRYYEAVDKGRGKATKKGAIPLKESIYQWIIQKGIPVTSNRGNLTAKGAGKKLGVGQPKLRSMIETQRRNMAYLIARKINRFGTKGNNFYSAVVNDSLFDDLQIDLSDSFKKDVLIDINKIEII
jgi:hypothetical protein